MTFNKAFPAHVGPNERSVNVNDLGRRNLRFEAGFDCTLENPTEPLLAPTLTDARQARMMG